MFLNELVVRIRGKDEYQVLRPMTYNGTQLITVPANFRTDFASVPGPLRWLMDGHGASRRPAVLHDYLYRKGIGTRKEADKLFHEALIGEGMSKWKARLAYWGVRLGGWASWEG